MKERLTLEEVIRRHKEAFARKDLWRSVYEEAYEYGLPQRNMYQGYYEGNVPGQGKMNRVFDSTAIDSTQKFANKIQSGLFPPYKKWCRLEAGNDIPPESRDEVQKKLDKYTDQMFTVMRQSNFDLAMGEFLLDLAVGTSVMLIQPGDAFNPIQFTAVPQYLIALEEGPQGTVDNVYRKYKIRTEAIMRTYPDAIISTELLRLIDNEKTEVVELFEAVIYHTERGDYCYHVIHPKSKSELVFRKIPESPWVVSRYMKVPGEVFRRGPLLTAIADIKTLNKTLELVLKNASLAIIGVYTGADDGVLNPTNVRIAPGSIIPVARNAGPKGESLAPLPSSDDFNVSQIIINDLRMNIKKILLEESLPPDNMSARSATEIVERMKELSQNLGSAFGRLITETMTPVVARVLSIMNEKGMIRLPLRVNGLEVKITPISPLAKAQNLDDINDVMQFAQIANSLGAGGQAEIKPEMIAKYVGDKIGMPADLRTSDEEKEQIQQQIMQMMQAQAQQESAAMAEPPVADENMPADETGMIMEQEAMNNE